MQRSRESRGRMAINPQTKHSNRHTGYIAASGYGKSQALKQNPDIPGMNKGARVLLWDPDDDHIVGGRYRSYRDFVANLREGIKSGRGFRLAWSCPNPTEEAFELFCRACWVALDGARETHIIIEELADVQKSSGKASNWFGQLCRKSRKYGGILHWTSQRAEEIPKTVFTQTANYYIGFPNDTCPPENVKKLARIARCPRGEQDLYDLRELQFYRKIGRESSLITLKTPR